LQRASCNAHLATRISPATSILQRAFRDAHLYMRHSMCVLRSAAGERAQRATTRGRGVARCAHLLKERRAQRALRRRIR
jgi:hypothetical protein